MNKLKDYQNNLKQMLDIINNGINSDKNTIERVNADSNTPLFRSALVDFSKNITSGLDFRNAVKFFLDLSKTEALNLCVEKLNLNEEEAKKLSLISNEELSAKLEEKFNAADPGYKNDEETQKTLMSLFARKTIFSNKDIYNSSFIDNFCNLAEEYGGERIDTIVPEKRNYMLDVNLTPEEANIHFADKEIDALIKQTKDKETIDILEDSKNIMVVGNVKNSHVNSLYAEHAGNIHERIRSKHAFDVIQKNPKLSDLGFEYDGVDYSENIKDDEKYFAFVDEIFNKKTIEMPSFSEEQIKSLNDIYNKLDEHNALNVEGESGNKEYTLLKLSNHKKAMKKALEENNVDEFIHQTKEYREEEKFVDSLLEEVKKLNPNKVMSANVSPARNTDIDGKYRVNPYAISNLNSVAQGMTLLKKNNFTLNQFLNDPITVGKEIVNKSLEKTDYINNETKNFNNENYIDKILESSFGNKKFNKRTIGFVGFDIVFIERALGGIGNAIGDKNDRLKYFDGMINVQKYASHVSEALNENKKFFDLHREGINLEQVAEQFKNVFSADFTKVGFNQIAGYGKPKFDYISGKLLQPYNPKTQAKNINDPNKQLEESLELYEKLVNGNKYNIPDDYKRGIRMGLSASMGLYNNKNKTYATRVIGEKLETADLNDINPELIKMFKSERKIAKFKEGNLTDERISDALSTIADLKKEYKKHGFFNKLFNSQTRAENKLINSLVRTTSEKTGMTIKNINQITKDLAEGRGIPQNQGREETQDLQKDIENIMQSDGLAEENENRKQLTLEEIRDKSNSTKAEASNDASVIENVKENSRR